MADHVICYHLVPLLRIANTGELLWCIRTTYRPYNLTNNYIVFGQILSYMEVTKGNIQSILNGSKQFAVPVYQRPYSWEQEQCHTLWKDIIAINNSDRPNHFMGSFVNITDSVMPTGIQRYVIVDGQQRLTTVILLMLAIHNWYLIHKEIQRADKIMWTYIKNDREEGTDRYKLLLSSQDKKILISLIDGKKLSSIDEKSLIYTNYIYFSKLISSNKYEIDQIINGMSKLLFVNITLDKTFDDPQMIFESLNSTGVGLSQSDLIRNYLLMNLDEITQQSIYNNYWLPIEHSSLTTPTLDLDIFFRDFLTLKIKKRIPKISEIYIDFRDYHKNTVDKNTISLDDFCNDVCEHYKYYNELFFSKTYDIDIDRIIGNISKIRMSITYPFLLTIYNDYKKNVINKETFIECSKLAESYVIRRRICGIPTVSQNITFTEILDHINEKDYLNSIISFFLRQKSYRRFPSNEEFKEAMRHKNLSHSPERKYILEKIENHNNKTPINSDNYTVEHIIPQKLTNEWKDMIGPNWKEVHEILTHTIGNLTLTGYNSEMSNRSFHEKLTMDGGFKQSGLRINRYIISQNLWRREEIEERARILCELAVEIWPYPYEVC